MRGLQSRPTERMVVSSCKVQITVNNIKNIQIKQIIFIFNLYLTLHFLIHYSVGFDQLSK